MRKLFIIPLLLLLSCSGLPLKEDSNTLMLSYLAGRGAGAAVMEFAPESTFRLETNWDKMMTSYKPGDTIQPESIVKFFNDSIGFSNIFLKNETTPSAFLFI